MNVKKFIFFGSRIRDKNKIVKIFQDYELLMSKARKQYIHDYYTHMTMKEQEIEQERKKILEIKAEAFNTILNIVYRPSTAENIFKQVFLTIQSAENRIKVIYARTGDRIVKDMSNEKSTLNKPLPELTYEEEERDFFKQEDTNDLELYKIKQKMVDIEKLVRVIHNEIVKHPPYTI